MALLEQHAARLRANPAALQLMQERFQGMQHQPQQSQPQLRPGKEIRGASLHDHAREASFSDWAYAAPSLAAFDLIYSLTSCLTAPCISPCPCRFSEQPNLHGHASGVSFSRKACAMS